MAHELTKVYQVDDGWEVRPSVGKNKGKTLKVFDTEQEAIDWSKKRSKNYKPSIKERRQLYKDDPKKWLRLYGGWDIGAHKSEKE